MKLFKRNAVILTVLMFVVVAAYLNWSYNRGKDQDALADSSPAVSSPAASSAVKDDDGGSDSADAANDIGGDNTDAGLYYEDETGDNTLTDVSDYFATARLTRQQARDSATSILQEAAATEAASQEVIDSALNEIAAMANYAIQEAQIENILIAKGFEDCVAFISAGGINIAVPSPIDGLSDAAVARITDAVMSESGSDAEIKIIEVK